ncbi:hypothetical protein [Rhabdaerophilum sp. SD176]|uniref:hypothetical protein n=1 Tax=Rhabdaerophilum sp. SD176 TaxID=2983548 RepID=UPI0024DF72FA|nr:hypothetical protein [Rhabdaerophilum sp. SD176]
MLTALMAPMVGSTIYSLRQIAAVDQRLDFVVDQRLPTVLDLSAMAFELADSIASVRGYML